MVRTDIRKYEDYQSKLFYDQKTLKDKLWFFLQDSSIKCYELLAAIIFTPLKILFWIAPKYYIQTTINGAYLILGNYFLALRDGFFLSRDNTVH